MSVSKPYDVYICLGFCVVWIFKMCTGDLLYSKYFVIMVFIKVNYITNEISEICEKKNNDSINYSTNLNLKCISIQYFFAVILKFINVAKVHIL